MNKYRKEDPMTKEDINVFKEQEINKIKEHLLEPPKRTFPWKVYIPTAVTILTTLFLIFILTMEDDPGIVPEDSLFQITQVSASEYMIESLIEEQHSFVYYTAYIVNEGSLLTFNDDFQYGMQYRYAPQEVQDQVTVLFDAVRIDQYRLILEIRINDDIRYMEIDQFPSLSANASLEGLTIVDFQTDIIDLFELIEDYPPVYGGVNEYGQPIYTANENISDIGDQRRIENYTLYVETYYAHEDDYTYDFTDESYLRTEMVNQIIIMDGTDIVDTTIHFHGYGGAHVTPDEMPDLVLSSFRIFSDSNEYPLDSNWMTYGQIDESVEGKWVNFYYEDKRYMYTYIDQTLSDVSLEGATKIRMEYRYHSFYDPNNILQVTTLPLITYEDKLVTEPIYLVDDYSQGSMISLLEYLKLIYLDDDGNMVYEIVLMDNY